MRSGPGWIRHVPNALSALRLLLAAAFALLPPAWRLPAVIVAGASDLFDGIIARRFDATSVAGALLDAVADKLFVLSVLLTLAAGGVIAWWQVPFVLVRDGVVAALAAWAAITHQWGAFRRMTPRATGKAATLLVFLWFVACLAPAPAAPLVSPAFWIAAGGSLVAGADYLFQYALELRRRRAEDPGA